MQVGERHPRTYSAIRVRLDDSKLVAKKSKAFGLAIIVDCDKKVTGRSQFGEFSEKCTKSEYFSIKPLHNPKKCSNFAAKL